MAAAGLPDFFVGEELRADGAQPCLRLGDGEDRAHPGVAVAVIWRDRALILGLGATQLALLTLTPIVSTQTIVPGRHVAAGALHLLLVAILIFLRINP